MSVLTMSPPVTGHVVRCIEDRQGNRTHGVQLIREPIRREESKPIRPDRPRRGKGDPVSNAGTRMYTIDLTVGDDGLRRTGR